MRRESGFNQGPSATAVIQQLSELVNEVPPSDCPGLIGHLEALKARVWLRMTTRPDNAPNEGKLLTVQETAERLNVPISRVYELTRQVDGLPTIRVGKYKRISSSALSAWMNKRLNGEA